MPAQIKPTPQCRLKHCFPCLKAAIMNLKETPL